VKPVLFHICRKFYFLNTRAAITKDIVTVDDLCDCSDFHTVLHIVNASLITILKGRLWCFLNVFRKNYALQHSSFQLT